MSSRAQALVLDFGGVISKTLFETHDVTERALGLAPGTLTWRGPFDPETDPLWVSMQRGEITERDYWLHAQREVGRLVGEDWTDMKTFVQRARGADPETVIRPEARACDRRAAECRLRLAILSNELDLFYGADFRERLPLLARFEVDRRRDLHQDPEARSARLRAGAGRTRARRAKTASSSTTRSGTSTAPWPSDCRSAFRRHAARGRVMPSAGISASHSA